MAIGGKFRYVPSPIPFKYHYLYSAVANRSGRMQYYRTKPGIGRERISRAEFIEVFNNSDILGLRPIPLEDAPVIQLEFYV